MDNNAPHTDPATGELCRAELQGGYGFAGGDGTTLGGYYWCEFCDYFERVVDPEVNDHA